MDEHCPPERRTPRTGTSTRCARQSRSASTSSPTIDEKNALEREPLRSRSGRSVEKVIEAREAEFSLPVVLYFARYFYLEEIDARWIDHLKAMEALREGIGLRGYGQKDPKQEYKKEGFVIFGEMMGIIGRNVCEKLFHMQVKRDEPAPAAAEAPPPGADPCRRPRPAPARKTIESGGGARTPQARPPTVAARRRRRRGAGHRSGATSPRSAATIRARAEAARNTRNATARRSPSGRSAPRARHRWPWRAARCQRSRSATPAVEHSRRATPAADRRSCSSRDARLDPSVTASRSRARADGATVRWAAFDAPTGARRRAGARAPAGGAGPWLRPRRSDKAPGDTLARRGLVVVNGATPAPSSLAVLALPSSTAPPTGARRHLGAFRGRRPPASRWPPSRAGRTPAWPGSTPSGRCGHDAQRSRPRPAPSAPPRRSSRAPPSAASRSSPGKAPSRSSTTATARRRPAFRPSSSPSSPTGARSTPRSLLGLDGTPPVPPGHADRRRVRHRLPGRRGRLAGGVYDSTRGITLTIISFAPAVAFGGAASPARPLVGLAPMGGGLRGLLARPPRWRALAARRRRVAARRGPLIFPSMTGPTFGVPPSPATPGGTLTATYADYYQLRPAGRPALRPAVG